MILKHPNGYLTEVESFEIHLGGNIFKIDETPAKELQIEKVVDPEDPDQLDMTITPINLNQIIID